MSQNQPSDTTTELLYILGGGLLALALAYHFFGDALLNVYLGLRHAWALAVITLLGHTPRLDLINQQVMSYDVREWTMAKLSFVSVVLRPYMFPVLAGVFGLYAYRVYRRNQLGKLRRKFDISSLARAQVNIWPWIAPVLQLDLIKQPIDKGEWAMARRPADFAKKYRLLDGIEINRARASKLFALQLGRLWEGPDRLPRYVRSLYACFAAQAAGAVKEARQGLAELTMGMASGEFDDTFCKQLLQRYADDPDVKAIAKKHAYVTTVLCATLAKARSYGVLPPNNFLWLRPLNRPLWYALNCTGRKTPFAEVAGVYAHQLAEQVAGHAIERPYVKEAVEALALALREIQFEPGPSALAGGFGPADGASARDSSTQTAGMRAASAGVGVYETDTV